MSTNKAFSKKLIPPYISYQTFKTFLEDLKGKMPTYIDRSVWGTRLSGSSGSQLMAALRYLELIDFEARPVVEFENLVDSSPRKKAVILEAVLRRSYAPLFTIDLSRSTSRQFKQKFSEFGMAERVQIKCERFFIHAARDAGVELSEYIVKGRHSSASSRNLRNRKETIQSFPRAVSQAKRTGGEPNATNSSTYLSLAELWINKFPTFDPKWDLDVRENWFLAMDKLQERLEHLIDLEKGS